MRARNVLKPVALGNAVLAAAGSPVPGTTPQVAQDAMTGDLMLGAEGKYHKASHMQRLNHADERKYAIRSSAC